MLSRCIRYSLAHSPVHKKMNAFYFVYFVYSVCSFWFRKFFFFDWIAVRLACEWENKKVLWFGFFFSIPSIFIDHVQLCSFRFFSPFNFDFNFNFTVCVCRCFDQNNLLKKIFADAFIVIVVTLAKHFVCATVRSQKKNTNSIQGDYENGLRQTDKNNNNLLVYAAHYNFNQAAWTAQHLLENCFAKIHIDQCGFWTYSFQFCTKFFAVAAHIAHFNSMSEKWKSLVKHFGSCNALGNESFWQLATL